MVGKITDKPGSVKIRVHSHLEIDGSSFCFKPDNIVKKAAEIAAWYSAAKHSELVPVLYTLKKYVRRGKNLPAGQVIVEREEVVIVRPSKTEHRTHKQ